MTEPFLLVRGLDVHYQTERGAAPALRNVEFSIGEREIVAIVGESGCGKSTLAAALLRLLPANGQISRGSILLKGRDLVPLADDEMRKVRGRDLAMVFQDPLTSLNPTFTVGTQMIKAQLSHATRHRAKQKTLLENAAAALAQVGLPDAAERLDDYPHQFSGGQRQRIMIATALLLQPTLLVADEPTSALDVTLEAQILELLRRLRSEHGKAIILITHDLGVVSQLCDRVIVMYAGEIVEANDTASILRHPRHPYTRALLDSVPTSRQRGRPLATIPGLVPSPSALPPGCTFADRCRHAHRICRDQAPQVIDGVRCHIYDPQSAHEWAGDQNVASLVDTETALPRHSDANAASLQMLVQAQNLSTYFYDRANTVSRLLGHARGAVRAVDGIDLEIHRGEVLGLVGESGSGKTTLGETILRLIAASGGDINFDGVSTRRMTRGDQRRFRQRAQMIFQDPHASLSPRLRVRALLTEPYAINRTPVADRLPADELLELVGLSSDLTRKYPHQLSGGQARRVGIARALALRPEFVIADEPTSGLDASAAAAVLNLMRDLRDRLGLTYLIITHNLNLVAYFADRIAVMYCGQVVEVGPTEQILERPAHPYTQALLALATDLDPEKRAGERRLLVPGEIPSPRNPPTGCRFHTRCAHAQERSRQEDPTLEEIGSGHFVACHFWREIRDATETAPPLKPVTRAPA